MPLILANGFPRSGTTFLYEVARDQAALANGFTHEEGKARFFPTVPDFVDEVPDRLVELILSQLPPDKFYVLKTHGRKTAVLASGIKRGDILAFVSFRDPRDTIVSMLERGSRDRAAQIASPFARLANVENAISAASFNFDRLRSWLGCPQVLRIPFLLIAHSQSFAVTLLCTFLGLEPPADFSQFVSGKPDRFLRDLPPADIMTLTARLSAEIRDYDAASERLLVPLGFGPMYSAARKERDAEIQKCPARLERARLERRPALKRLRRQRLNFLDRQLQE